MLRLLRDESNYDHLLKLCKIKLGIDVAYCVRAVVQLAGYVGRE